MRPLSLDERTELMMRTRGRDILDFVHELKYLRRKYKMSCLRLLAMLERAPRPTNLNPELLLFVRRMLAEEGREFTPAEVTECVEDILCRIRNVMEARGIQPPDDDASLLALLS